MNSAVIRGLKIIRRLHGKGDDGRWMIADIEDLKAACDWIDKLEVVGDFPIPPPFSSL